MGSSSIDRTRTTVRRIEAAASPPSRRWCWAKQPSSRSAMTPAWAWSVRSQRRVSSQAARAVSSSIRPASRRPSASEAVVSAPGAPATGPTARAASTPTSWSRRRQEPPQRHADQGVGPAPAHRAAAGPAARAEGPLVGVSSPWGPSRWLDRPDGADEGPRRLEGAEQQGLLARLVGHDGRGTTGRAPGRAPAGPATGRAAGAAGAATTGWRRGGRRAWRPPGRDGPQAPGAHAGAGPPAPLHGHPLAQRPGRPAGRVLGETGAGAQHGQLLRGRARRRRPAPEPFGDGAQGPEPVAVGGFARPGHDPVGQLGGNDDDGAVGEAVGGEPPPAPTEDDADRGDRLVQLRDVVAHPWPPPGRGPARGPARGPPTLRRLCPR